MQGRTPAQQYALVVGGTLVAAGIIGFFYNSSFGTGEELARDPVLGLLDVNAWLNLVHIATGALGLAALASYAGSRSYAIGLGLVYLVVTVLGFIAGDGEEIFNLIPVNTEDNIFHLALGVAGLAAGLATPGAPAPTTAPPPASPPAGATAP